MTTSRATSESKSLGELYPLEQARCRELLAEYKKIGPAGFFGATMIEQILRNADAMVIQGNTVGMLIAYEQMKGCE